MRGSAHSITTLQSYLFLKHIWTILNMKFLCNYLEVGKINQANNLYEYNYCISYTGSDAGSRLTKIQP